MSFGDDIKRFLKKVNSSHERVFAEAADHVYESVVNGSPITSAPGQPVDTGALRASWQHTTNAPLDHEITTKTVYAPLIEDGVSTKGRPLRFRSQVGGAHSVKLTIAGWQRIVDVAAATVNQRN